MSQPQNQNSFPHPNTPANDLSLSAYAAARQAQLLERLRRRLGSSPLWTELRTWFLAQPERWRRWLAALRRWPTASRLATLVLSAGLTAGVVGQPVVALAQEPVPVGGEFRVNSYTTDVQEMSSIGMDQDGDFVITWQSYEQDGSQYGIFAQRFSAGGTPQGDEFQVNTYTSARQADSSIAIDQDGDFVIVWRDGTPFQGAGQDGSDAGIFARRYSADGTPQDREFQVNTYTTGSQADASVAMDSDGDFIVTWASYNQDGHSGGIFAQQYNASGTPQGSEFQVNTYTTGTQESASVAMDSDGDFIVTWASHNQDGHSGGIFAQRYNAFGTPQGSEFQVNTYTTGTQESASVAMDSDGDFVVVWQDGASFANDGQDGSLGGIFARIYGADGIPQSGEFQINTYTTNSQTTPNVAMDQGGDFVIVWTSYGQDGHLEGIYARRFSADGTPQSDEFQVNTITLLRQTNPVVIMSEDDDFVVSWTGSSGAYDVYARRYRRLDNKVYLPTIVKE